MLVIQSPAGKRVTRQQFARRVIRQCSFYLLTIYRSINMQVNQTGFANGQHGVIVEVYENGALFKSDTGAVFTIKTKEFTPD